MRKNALILAAVGLAIGFCLPPAVAQERLDPAAAVAAAFSGSGSLAVNTSVPPDSAASISAEPLSTVTPAVTKAAVCRVDVYPGGDLTYNGTGTCVWQEEGYSLILTAYHVVEHPGVITVTHDGKRYRAERFDLVPGNDLALLWLTGELPVARLAADKPAVGAKVRHFGLSSGGGTGVVTQYVASPTGHVMVTDYRSESGDSGAAVFAGDEIVGVHTGRWGSGLDSAPRKVVPVPYVNELCASGKTGKRFPRAGRLFGRNVQPAAAFPGATFSVTTTTTGGVGSAVGVAGGCVAGCPCPNAGAAGAKVGPGGTTGGVGSGGPTPPVWVLPPGFSSGPVVTGGDCPGGVCGAASGFAPAQKRGLFRGRAD